MVMRKYIDDIHLVRAVLKGDETARQSFLARKPNVNSNLKKLRFSSDCVTIASDLFFAECLTQNSTVLVNYEGQCSLNHWLQWQIAKGLFSTDQNTRLLLQTRILEALAQDSVPESLGLTIAKKIILENKLFEKPLEDSSSLSDMYTILVKEARLSFARLALGGDEQACQCILERKGILISSLTVRGASFGLAEDIVNNAFADCFGATKSVRTGEHRKLLEQYQGRASLTNWLKKIIGNSYVHTSRSPENSVSELDQNTEEKRPEWADYGFDTMQLVLDAFRKAFGILSPEIRFFLLQKYIYRVPQDALASLWDCDSSTICRKIQKGCAFILEEIEKQTSREQISAHDIFTILKYLLDEWGRGETTNEDDENEHDI